MSSAFHNFLLERYPAVAVEHPQLGRRKTRLRVVDDFFRLDSQSRQPYVAANEPSAELLNSAACARDPDPIDATLSDAPGVIVRTDFSDDTAWTALLSVLSDGEKEMLAAMQSPADNADDSGSDSDSEQESAPILLGSGSKIEVSQLTFFSIVNPAGADDRARLADVCNLAVLRLVTDAGVRIAPPVPRGTKRIKPGHRLVDLDGFQERYSGPGVWIYDAQSNADGAVRMVNSEGDIYGTVTGDSWRVRASHITEMQVNMAFHGMRVNFGGMDRWDYTERVRNLEFANEV